MTDETVFADAVREAAAELTDVPAPADAWRRIAARVQAGDTVVLPVEPATDTARRANTRALRIAALALLTLGGAAAAAIADPSVRDWIDGIFGGDTNAAAGLPALPAPPVLDAAAAAASEMVLIVEPSGGRVAIAIETASPGVRLRVTFADARDIQVRARGRSADARFRTSAGRLVVSGATGGELLLTLPRRAVDARVEVDGRVYLTHTRGLLQVLAPVSDTIGSEIVIPIGGR